MNPAPNGWSLNVVSQMGDEHCMHQNRSEVRQVKKATCVKLVHPGIAAPLET